MRMWFSTKSLVLLAFLNVGIPISQADEQTRYHITVVDLTGKTAYSGPCVGLLYPFEMGIEVANPNGIGILRIFLEDVAECSFVRISKETLTPLDIAKMKLDPQYTQEEHLRRWPLRIKYCLRDGKEYTGTSGYGEGITVSAAIPDARNFEIGASKLQKVVFDAAAPHTSKQNPRDVTVVDWAGKTAYSGPSLGGISPFCIGIEVAGPNGIGVIKKALSDDVVECSFVRISWATLTQLDIMNMKLASPQYTTEEHISRAPLRIRYRLSDGKEYINTWGYAEEATVSVPIPGGRTLEMKARELGKIVFAESAPHAKEQRKYDVTVVDLAGKTAYSGPCVGYLYPFDAGIEVADPNGIGTAEIPFGEVVECSFVRISKDTLTPLDIAKMKRQPQCTQEEHIRRWPFRIRYRLGDGKEYIGTSGYGERVRVAVEIPGQQRLEVNIDELQKILITR